MFPFFIFVYLSRLRAAKVDDFVAALKLVHTDFEWPLPVTLPSPLGGGVSIGAEGDAPPSHRNGSEVPTVMVRGSPADSESTSEESWWPEEEDVAPCVGVADFRGPPQAEAQARHLLQILGQARCCDWALTLALMLGDTLVAPLVAPPGALEKLQVWASTDCPGYLGLLRQVQGHGPEETPGPNGCPQRSPSQPRRIAPPPARDVPEEGCRVA